MHLRFSLEFGFLLRCFQNTAHVMHMAFCIKYVTDHYTGSVDRILTFCLFYVNCLSVCQCVGG